MTEPGSIGNNKKWLQVFSLLSAVFLFLVSLDLMSLSFEGIGEGFVRGLVETTSNPFIGLFVGILTTAILQSSSATTSMIVALVASGALGEATDPETISKAVPLIMGANVGTTVTSTLVALGHITSKNEYRKAIAAATVHDFFNILTLFILFPLEIGFGVLSYPAASLVALISPASGQGSFFSGLTMITRPISDFLIGLSDNITASPSVTPYITLPFALLLLFSCFRWLSFMLEKIFIGGIRRRMSKAIFGNAWKSLGWGFTFTAILQSSSAITSLSVPLVAKGYVPLSRVFPFLIGANIGTTTTALLAALMATGKMPEAGLAIALTHVLFNVFGGLIFMPILRLRHIPVRLAGRLGKATYHNRIIGIAYIAITFFLIPFLLIMLSRAVDKDDAMLPGNETNLGKTTHYESNLQVDPSHTYRMPVKVDPSGK